MHRMLITAAAAFLALSGVAAAQSAACYVGRDDADLYFAALAAGVALRAESAGVSLDASGAVGEDAAAAQVQAIDACVEKGVDGVLVAPADRAAAAEAAKRARDAGVLVVALDTPLEPPEAADATFATDNRKAGELLGAWAAGRMGDAAAEARVAILESATGRSWGSDLRREGFLAAFGTEPDEDRMLVSAPTGGDREGGRREMAALLEREPAVSLVYAGSDAAAAGAREALEAAGRADALVISSGGGCTGVRDVAEGVIDALAQHYPTLMAAMGIEALVAWDRSGALPPATPGLDFFDTGVNLVARESVDGVFPISVEEALDRCYE